MMIVVVVKMNNMMHDNKEVDDEHVYNESEMMQHDDKEANQEQVHDNKEAELE